MPCGVYSNDEIYRMNDAALVSARRAACDMRTVLRRHGLEHELCKETVKWIREHDAEDAMRIELEQREGLRKRQRQAALDKLTMDERRMLGL